MDKLVKLSQIVGVSLDELVTGAEFQLKAETPPLPVTESPRMPGRKIAGIVLSCMAFLTFLVLTALGGIREGLLLASPFLVCGIICSVSYTHLVPCEKTAHKGVDNPRGSCV